MRHGRAASCARAARKTPDVARRERNSGRYASRVDPVGVALGLIDDLTDVKRVFSYPSG
jgi:hypothetical protein